MKGINTNLFQNYYKSYFRISIQTFLKSNKLIIKNLKKYKKHIIIVFIGAVTFFLIVPY